MHVCGTQLKPPALKRANVQCCGNVQCSTGQPQAPQPSISVCGLACLSIHSVTVLSSCSSTYLCPNCNHKAPHVHIVLSSSINRGTEMECVQQGRPHDDGGQQANCEANLLWPGQHVVVAQDGHHSIAAEPSVISGSYTCSVKKPF